MSGTVFCHGIQIFNKSVIWIKCSLYLVGLHLLGHGDRVGKTTWLKITASGNVQPELELLQSNLCLDGHLEQLCQKWGTTELKLTWPVIMTANLTSCYFKTFRYHVPSIVMLSIYDSSIYLMCSISASCRSGPREKSVTSSTTWSSSTRPHMTSSTRRSQATGSLLPLLCLKD